MAIRTEFVAEVPQVGTLCKTKEFLPFDDFLAIAKKERIPSIRDVAYCRIFLGEDDPMSETKLVTREGILFTKHYNPILIKDSPALDNFRSATNTNREFNEYYVSNSKPIIRKAIEDLKVNPLQRKFIFLPSRNYFKINNKSLIDFFPNEMVRNYAHISSKNLEECVAETKEVIESNRVLEKETLDKDPITYFALSVLKDVSLAYALFNKRDMYIKIPDVEYTHAQEPFVRQVQLDYVRNSSSLECFANRLDDSRQGYFIIP